MTDVPGERCLCISLCNMLHISVVLTDITYCHTLSKCSALLQ